MADELEPSIGPALASVNSHLLKISEAIVAAVPGLTTEQVERVTNFFIETHQVGIETQQAGASSIQAELNALREEIVKERLDKTSVIQALREEIAEERQDKTSVIQEFAEYRTRAEAHAKKLQGSVDELTILHKQTAANASAALVAARADDKVINDAKLEAARVADKALADAKFAQLEMRLLAHEERAEKQRAQDKAERDQEKAIRDAQIAKIVEESQLFSDELVDLRDWNVSQASCFW